MRHPGGFLPSQWLTGQGASCTQIPATALALGSMAHTGTCSVFTAVPPRHSFGLLFCPASLSYGFSFGGPKTPSACLCASCSGLFLESWPSACVSYTGLLPWRPALATNSLRLGKGSDMADLSAMRVRRGSAWRTQLLCIWVWSLGCCQDPRKTARLSKTGPM